MTCYNALILLLSFEEDGKEKITKGAQPPSPTLPPPPSSINFNGNRGELKWSGRVCGGDDVSMVMEINFKWSDGGCDCLV